MYHGDCQEAARDGQDAGNAVSAQLQALAKEAESLAAQRAVSRTRALIEQMLMQAPVAPALWKMLGLAYWELGRRAEATRALWAASRFAPQDADTQQLLNKALQQVQGDSPQDHPEAAALAVLCHGRGLDVGCGHRKTHPDAIGVDRIPGGAVGEIGVVAGQRSVADVCASGDDLHMFADAEVDYVVSRHTLEHFQDPLKALEEWRRILRPSGVLGLVLPDDTDCDTIRLDPTHKHVFTPDSFARLMRCLGGFEPVHLGVCLHHWSFVAIYRKQGGFAPLPDYRMMLRRAAVERCRAEAGRRLAGGDTAMARECLLEAEALDAGQADGFGPQV